jgi:hypothetical protein
MSGAEHESTPVDAAPLAMVATPASVTASPGRAVVPSYEPGPTLMRALGDAAVDKRAAVILDLQTKAGNHAVSELVLAERAGILARNRAGFDPRDRRAWGLVGKPSMRKNFPEEFEATLGRAPEAGMAVEQALAEAGPPRTPEEREAFAARIRMLIRMRALGLMASHRATMEGRRDAQVGAPKQADGASKQGQAGQIDDAQTATIMRAAAAQLERLQEIREELRASRHEIDVVRGSVLIQRRTNDKIAAWLERLHAAIQRHQSDAAIDYWNNALQVIMRRRSPTAQAGPVWKLATALYQWRGQQISGVSVAMHRLYSAFPFMSEMDLEDITGNEFKDDKKLMGEARGGYAKLLEQIDKAIVMIGSGDIDPFDMPEVVQIVQRDLDVSLQSAMARVLQDHRTTEFWTGVGLTALQLAIVFIPVVGPVLAAGIGGVQVAVSVESMMDRELLASSSGDPERGMLGVEPAGAFEYAMLGVEAALTLVDMKMAWSDVAKLRPKVRPAPDGPPPPRGKDVDLPEGKRGLGSPESHDPDSPEVPRTDDGQAATRPGGQDEGAAAHSGRDSPEVESGQRPPEGLEPADRAWEEGISAKTRKALREDDRLADFWHDMDPEIRRVLTHCSDYCIPRDATKGQARRIGELLRKMSEKAKAGLREFLYMRRGDLDAALDELDALKRGRSASDLLEEKLRDVAATPAGFKKSATTAKELRYSPGKATGGNSLPNATDDWLRASGGRAGLVPGQVAKALRGQTFETFDDLRKAFWKAVAADSELAAGFSKTNVDFMKKGEAPIPQRSQHHKGHDVFVLHHIVPIEYGGAVYDLDNLIVVSPRTHQAVHYD